MLSVIRTKNWDDDFFLKFVNFRNEIHKNIETSFPETKTDYSKYFGPKSPFLSDYDWQGFIVLENDQVLAKAILTVRNGTEIGNLGFLDWVNRLDAAQLLIDEVEKWAISKDVKTIKTPVDMNFFIKYRIRYQGDSSPFMGEPIYPAYYHDLFETTGFHIINRWDTYQMIKSQVIKDFFFKSKKISAERPKHTREINIRKINLNRWDDELKIVHSLFVSSYHDMPEYEPISYEQFKLIYDDFKYIIHPWFSYIVEYRNRPVGFCINYPDPLRILKSIKKNPMSIFQRIKIYIRLRMNFDRLLISYVGKVNGPDGEEIKGVQIKVSQVLTKYAWPMKSILVCYQSSDSPSRRSFNQSTLKPFAKYLLYGKDLK